jgi:putative tryptophan/tyrosine transport system substrate-binding protein
VNRRAFIWALASAWPLAARAQQSERVRRVGLLQGLAEDDPEWQRRFVAFRQSLQDLGWTEGQNIAFEARFADGKPERLAPLAAELVRANVNVIVTNAAQPIEAARKATSTIPIVMASVGDAVAAGYVASLARPGANVTGLTLVATDQSAKRLQLLKEIVPNLVRVALFWNGNASGHRLQLREMEVAAPGLGMTLQSLPLRSAEDIDAALQASARANAQAFFTMDDPLVQSQRARIVAFAMRQRLPVMGEFRSIPEAGGLASYGPNLLDNWRRAALYVDKIFRGAKPADLPVEQPTKFELVINLKTAAALGLTLAPGVLAIADEVIE